MVIVDGVPFSTYYSYSVIMVKLGTTTYSTHNAVDKETILEQEYVVWPFQHGS